MNTRQMDEADFLTGLRYSISVGRNAFSQVARDSSTDQDTMIAIEMHFAALEDVIEAREVAMRRIQ